jgi:16S rRNA (cytosine967-C5)-methyltransferase
MTRPDQRRRPAARAANLRGTQRSVDDPARAAALEVLRGVDEHDAYANLLLGSVLNRAGLDGRDAAFATELTAGTLRMRGLYDAVLTTLVGRRLSELDPAVLDVLRLGSHQLLSMRVPSHAAVSTSVDLVRASVGPRPAGLVNAVLRKVAARDLDRWVDSVTPPGADRLDRLALRYSHPRWIVEELQLALAGAAIDAGEDAHAVADTAVEHSEAAAPVAVGKSAPDDELARLLAADNDVGAVTLVARPGLAGREELLVPGARPGTLSPWAVRLPGGNPADVRAVREHRAGVQDEGSQVVAWLCAHVSVTGRDVNWLDLCAGPGGKAALLGAVAAERGARLVANEIQQHRAALVRQAVQGLSNVTVTTQDGRSPSWEPGSFDRVLVDAPCTGIGALRRRPEARWRRQPQDVAPLVRLQRDLLVSALDSVRAGGVVVYATCSPLLAETQQVVDWAQSQRPVRVRRLPSLPPDARVAVDFLQLWPHRHDTDAMFAAVLERLPQ